MRNEFDFVVCCRANALNLNCHGFQMFSCLVAFQNERTYQSLDFTDMQVSLKASMLCDIRIFFNLDLLVTLQPEWWSSNFAGEGVMNNYNRRAGDLWVNSIPSDNRHHMIAIFFYGSM